MPKKYSDTCDYADTCQNNNTLECRKCERNWDNEDWVDNYKPQSLCVDTSNK